MTTPDHTPPAVEALVDSMLSSYGQLAMLIDHMMRHGGSPDADPIPVVLRRLLFDALAPLPMRHGLEDVATTAQMLAAATDLIGEEIFLVDPDRPASRGRRSSRSGGGRGSARRRS